MSGARRQILHVASPHGPLELRLEIERWPLKQTFRMNGACWDECEVLVVTASTRGTLGRGEAAGVSYGGETCDSMLHQITSALARCDQPLTRETLQIIMPTGGARNAVDCALWDLDAALAARPVWELAGLDAPQPVLTTFTCGIGEPSSVARSALGYSGARAIKLKLAGDADDARRVTAVRAALPDVWLGVDANQALDRYLLDELLPTLVENRVALLEQPFPLEKDHWLDGLSCSVPIAADESAQHAGAISSLAGRFDVVNIKLDKCGGFTAALEMLHACRMHGLRPMIGNMLCTSLGLAPAWVLGHQCEIADLDGPIFLKSDRSPAVRYEGAFVSVPAGVWGQ